MRRLVENLGQERRQSLHYSKPNDCDVKEGRRERSLQGRTGCPESRNGKEQ